MGHHQRGRLLPDGGYTTSYITSELGRSDATALISSSLALVAFAVSAGIGGRLSDRHGRVPVAATAAVALAVVAVPPSTSSAETTSRASCSDRH